MESSVPRAARLEFSAPGSGADVQQSGGLNSWQSARSPPQIVLILVGLIGSGKSTFAQALQQYRPDFLRCNQDELGNRRRVEEHARRQLQRGGSVCIDRTNIDANQRAVWISLAREFPGTSAWVLHFDTPFNVCEERLRSRVGHPTILSAEQGIEVLHRFSSLYQQPLSHEGYDKFLRLDVTEQPLLYSQDAVTNILDRLRNSPPVVAEGGRGFVLRGANYRGWSRGYRGGSYNSYRGRGSQGWRSRAQSSFAHSYSPSNSAGQSMSRDETTDAT